MKMGKKKWDFFKLALACLRAMLGLYIEIPIPKRLAYRIYYIACILVTFMMKAIYSPRLTNQVASIKEIVDKQSPFELVGDRFAERVNDSIIIWGAYCNKSSQENVHFHF